MSGWRSGWPGWNGSSVVTATTPRCPRRQTTCLGARRRRGRPASGRNVAGVSSQGRPGRGCRGWTTQMRRCRCSQCADCGAGLADGADAGVSSRQVFDVPPVTVRVTEYMLYKKQCRCGCVTVATPPAGVADAPVSYGPNLQAFVAYLLVFQHVPVHRAAMLIADLTGACLLYTSDAADDEDSVG